MEKQQEQRHEQQQPVKKHAMLFPVHDVPGRLRRACPSPAMLAFVQAPMLPTQTHGKQQSSDSSLAVDVGTA